LSNEPIHSEQKRSVTLRAVTPDDEPFLFEVFAATRLDEFRFLEEQQKQALIRMQYNAQRFQYDEGFPQAESRIILLDDRPVGRMLVDESEREFVLVDIALLPQHRKSGIGTQLLKELLNRAVVARKPIRLHVLKSNPALRLYERLGFSRVADESMYLEMVFEPAI
jgi:ribosomal protein S18 acetylase RimI-like enzyme